MTNPPLRPVLVVLRGNSASGKSTVARGVQGRFTSGDCALIEQDHFRRAVLRERDVVGALNIDLMEQAASTCLERGLVVIVEGILNAARYESMLHRLSAKTPRASLFYAYDLSLAETSRRHVTRAKSVSFGSAEMGEWYHGWQPLAFVSEVRIDSSWTENEAIDRIAADIAAARATGR
ncbi:zeta toxin family protein [Lacisediminihabitans profunda]|uniref:zeta toxin family protein n=1 Tax=Lacisediminihabitans profunda TaxID=2594790 RepID=UPI001650C407|nr:zeta toxin family protein [Lacisediminihabitans profunda]